MSQAYDEPFESQSTREDDPPVSAAGRQNLLDLAICFGLILSTLAVYAQVGNFDFIYYDDDQYVFQNSHVQAGLTPAGIKWALTAVVAGNWMPVTLFSHLLDAQLFGIQSGMHHLVNVVFHALSAVLLFLFLRRATGSSGLSAFVACVFALHPLHVESVAWVSERKDVLSAFFWFLALYAYVGYAERPSLGRYFAVAALFCLGLMCKPMLVTFPFTLLLLDMWPLRRAQWPKTILEKLPLFALSAVASTVTYFVQKSAGAVGAYPFAARVANAFMSYVTYIVEMLWPARLAVIYPYLRSVPAWQAVAAFAFVLAVSALAISAWRIRPYLTVGWLWYLGTMVPVIGLVQVGDQAHADRYMYIPMVGLLVMLTWGAADVVRKWPRIQPAAAAVAVVSCAACLALAWKETSYWQNTGTLFQHAIDVTQYNWHADSILGLYLAKTGRDADAIPYFEAALRIKPEDEATHNNFGVSLSNLDDCAAAVPHFKAALRAKPGLAVASRNLGNCLVKSRDYEAAIPYLEAAIRADPGSAEAHFNLGVSLSNIPGRASDAIGQYEAALRLTPGDGRAQANLGQLLASLGRTEEAISHLEAAQHIHPDPTISKILAGLRAGQR